LPALPPLPVTGIPAELLNRRPDVQRDFLAVLAADRDLASAISDQYPRISLTGSVTTAAEKPENLFREWIASIAGQIVAPLFDGGQRRAEVDRTSAVAQQRIADYERTVLIAYREVEDALARERYLHERIASLNIQLELARQSSIQLREQYVFFGETDYLDVLSAITEEQRLQRAALSARLELVLARIALYVALAGDIESGARDLGNDCDI
jgi:outer membrane protein TolC